MLYNEITASGLVKVDMQGEVVEAGTTNFGVNVAGFMLHAAIHSARPDLKCVVHVHTPNIIAVSSRRFWNPWGVRNIRSFPIFTFWVINHFYCFPNMGYSLIVKTAEV